MLTRAIIYLIIIIISKTALFDPWSFLEYSARFLYPPAMCSELDHAIFTSIDFAISFLQKMFVSRASNAQPEGLRTLIYVPRREGGPVTPPGTGIPFRRLLLLAGLHWRYSNRPS
jgi:hypothetical protein